MKVALKNGESLISAEVKQIEGVLSVSLGPNNHQFELLASAPPKFLLRVENQILTGFAIREKDDYFVNLNGRTFRLTEIPDDGIAADASQSGDLRVVAPMPGTVIKVLVKEGETVHRRQPLVIVEAMKMENEVCASSDSIVDKILVNAGEKVGFGQELVKLSKPLDAGGETPAL